MSRIKGSNWKTGVKDEWVYIEVWNGDNTFRVLDGTFSPEQARGLANSLIAAADKLEQQ